MLLSVSACARAARQLTEGPFDHPGGGFGPDGIAWATDGKAVLFAANRKPGGEYDPLDTEIFEVSLGERRMKNDTRSTFGSRFSICRRKRSSQLGRPHTRSTRVWSRRT